MPLYEALAWENLDLSHVRGLSLTNTSVSLAIIPRRSSRTVYVVAMLENVIAETGTAPTYVRWDNELEFTAVRKRWLPSRPFGAP
jgi:hypothetical protein